MDVKDINKKAEAKAKTLISRVDGVEKDDPKGKGKEKASSISFAFATKDNSLEIPGVPLKPQIIKEPEGFRVRHPFGALCVLRSLFNQKEFSDLTLVCSDETEFYVHKGLLAAWSDVFEAMLKSSMIESKADVIHVREGDSDVWGMVLQYLYTSRIAIDEDNVFKVIYIAEQYQLKNLSHDCEKYLKRSIDQLNCCALLEMAVLHSMGKLEKKCIATILKKFDAVSETEKFYELDNVTIGDILSSDNLRTKSERTVLSTVLRWVEKDPENRGDKKDELLKHVRFPMMKPKELAALKKDMPPGLGPEFSKMLMDAFLYNASPKTFSVPEDDKRFEPRHGAFNAKMEFKKTGNIEEFTLPHSGLYRFTVMGAAAEDGANKKGGKGAIIKATYKLKRNSVLTMLVGGKSERSSSGDTGGGGGTFIAIDGKKNPLIVAGGGGGTRGSTGDNDGRDASLTEDGLDGCGSHHAKGGKGGKGGDTATSSYGGGGGGYFGDGSGKAFVNGGTGGSNGGFGGGGARGSNGGGGGGGYSGGGGGQGAGGGGSFVRDDHLEVHKEVGNEGDGSITIEYVD